jgi:hypothetical protein
VVLEARGECRVPAAGRAALDRRRRRRLTKANVEVVKAGE